MTGPRVDSEYLRLAEQARPVQTTRLKPAEEALFRQWAQANAVNDVDAPQSFYDYRGYWKDIASRGGNQTKAYSDGLHFPDTYKQHGHPTFSQESKYSTGVRDGGVWKGEDFVAPSPLDSLVMTDRVRQMLLRRVKK